MTSFLIAVFLIGMSMLLAATGTWYVRKRVSFDVLRENHEVGGYIFGAIATLYAVLLGLVVLDVQAKYQEAKLMAESEANAVADIFHMAEVFPPVQRMKLRNLANKYVTDVADQEWNSNQRDSANLSRMLVRELRSAVFEYEPVTNREQAVYEASLTTLSQLADSRRFRVAADISVSPVLWAVLVVGGIVAVIFTYFFAVKSVRAQMAMTALLAMSITLNLLLVLLFSNPYHGDLRIKPQAFVHAQRVFAEILDKK